MTLVLWKNNQFHRNERGSAAQLHQPKHLWIHFTHPKLLTISENCRRHVARGLKKLIHIQYKETFFMQYTRFRLGVHDDLTADL